MERPGAAHASFRDEVPVFRRPRPWPALATSTVVIRATFSAFSYFTPILTEMTGFEEGPYPCCSSPTAPPR